MSSAPPEDERDLLAAELALGLLEGEELLTARGRAAQDPGFADTVRRWEGRLAPLIEEVREVPPPAGLWDGIERAIGAANPGGGEVVTLRRKVSLWKGFAAGASAIAASLALLVGYQATRETPVPVQPDDAPVLIATLSSEEAPTSLAVAYDREAASLLVTPGRLAEPAGRAHQLWIIPAGGSPISLGLVRSGAPQRLAVPAPVAARFAASATIALSVEPPGGSPTGQPTGPVVAAGELLEI